MESTAYYDFEPMVQGTDWERTLEFKTNGVADDLTDWDAHATFRDKPNIGGAIVIDLTTTPNAQGSVIVISASTGLVTFRIVDVDSDSFAQDVLYWDLKMTGPPADGSKESVPIRGTLPVIRKITV